MSVDIYNSDLSRFRFSCPAWWNGFNRGARAERERAINEFADWREGDFQRAAVAKFREETDA